MLYTYLCPHGCGQNFTRTANRTQHAKTCKKNPAQPFHVNDPQPDNQLDDGGHPPDEQNDEQNDSSAHTPDEHIVDNVHPPNSGNREMELLVPSAADCTNPDMNTQDAALLKLQLQYGLSNGATAAFAR